MEQDHEKMTVLRDNYSRKICYCIGQYMQAGFIIPLQAKLKMKPIENG